MRPHDCGNAGCRSCGRNIETGTHTQLYEASVQGIDADTRWTVVCRDHATIVESATLARAYYDRAHPTEWCDDCRDQADKRKAVADKAINLFRGT